MSNVLTCSVPQKALFGFVLGCCLFLIPNGVQSATTNSATFSWVPNSESDLAGYNFYQGTTSRSYGLAVDVGNTTTYTTPPLQAGNTYYFVVTAFDVSGNESLPSNEVSLHIPDSSPDLTPPSITLTSPSNGSIVSDPVTITAAATDNIGVVGVQFQLNGSNLGAEDTTNTFSVLWDPNGVSSGQYFLTATARDAAGNLTTSDPINVTVPAPPDSTPPSVPGLLIAQASSSTQISLNWTASMDNVGITAYHIFRNEMSIGTTTATNYLDTNLAPLTTYTYTITASDAAGNESAPSTPVSATTLEEADRIPPSIPVGVEATILSASEVALAWQASTDNGQIAGYRIIRNNVPLVTTVTPSYRDSGLTTGVAYSYTVVAFDEAGNISVPSDPVSVTLSPASSMLSVSIVGSGKVTSNPAGLSCSSGTCSESFGAGSTITLTARADKKWKFNGWTGACNGSNECILQLPTDQDVVATFSKGNKGRGKGRGRKR